MTVFSRITGSLTRCTALLLALSFAMPSCGRAAPPAVTAIASAAESIGGEPVAVATGSKGDGSGVAIVELGSGVGRLGWSPVPVTVHLVPLHDGVVWYRWGAGPGGWRPAIGPIVAPEGKQLLSAVLVTDGEPGPVVTRTIRSDFTTPLSHLSAAETGVPAQPSVQSPGAVSVNVIVRPAGGTHVRRVGGRDRYEVAAGVSSGFDARSIIIIASGEKFPDALTASGLAGCLDAPLLLTRRTSLPGSVVKEITRLGCTRVIVCGGPMSVDPAVVKHLRSLGVRVERIDGKDRFEVAANTAARIRALGGGNRALIARGDLYPDALSLGPIAYARKEPILLVMPGSMPAATRTALQSGYGSAAIAGGPVSVNPSVASQVAGIVGPTVRWGGANRYEAAVTIASAGVASGGNSWKYVAIAKGTDYADALTGGAGAGRRTGVLLLSAPEPLSAPTDKALRAQTGQIAAVDVLGGPASITERTYEQIRTIFR